MEYLIRFAQAHESFRLPEIKALATLAEIDVEVVFYDRFVCVFIFFLLQRSNKLRILLTAI